MKDQDLQKIGLVVGALVFLIASKLPDAALSIVILWGVILLFDCADNRGRPDMIMFDNPEARI